MPACEWWEIGMALNPAADGKSTGDYSPVHLIFT